MTLSMSRVSVLLLLVALMLWLDEATAPTLMRVRGLSIGGQTITVEVADTSETIMRGLMFREWLPPNHGMLFVFEREQRVCMWMKNTRIPLSAAFFDGDGRVLHIVDMEPLSQKLHCSPSQTRYVLEMNRGWFERHGVRVGSRVEDLARPNLWSGDRSGDKNF